MTKLDFESDIEIDETALDVEWLDQPRLMLRYCKHAADMRREVDLAKEALDVARAEADRAIRKSPSEYGIEKVTEASVQAAITTHKSYQEAVARHIEAKYEYEVALAAVRSFEQRKTALENLVRLHGASYFSGPSVPRDLSLEKQRAERRRASNEKVRIRRT